MMGQWQTMDPAATVAADKEAGGALMRRIMPVVAVAAVMVALMVASVKPAFAAPNTTYTCFSDVSGDLAAEGLSEGQAKQFENYNLDTFCVPTGQEQLAEEVLTGNRKIPPGQLKRAEERIAVL